MINRQILCVFISVFAIATVLGFWAVKWRPGDLNRLQEWGLAGRRFGTIVSWFLLGGDIYTAYTFIALPGLSFSTGALAFYSVPATILIYPFVFLVLSRFWVVARHRGYVTSADFVRERFGSGTLALLTALVGILALLPFMALQMYAIEIVLAQMGIPVELALIIAFVLVSAYTYSSGLRAAGLIAVLKDVMIWIVVLVGMFYIPAKLGGFAHIMASVPKQMLTLRPAQVLPYSTLALGVALSLVLFPHNLTGMLSTNSRKVIQRNAAFLPAYTILNGCFALFGFMALAAHVHLSSVYKTNSALPVLYQQMFPSWFTGIAFAAIAVSGLVPTAIMSIAIGNLFTRNIYREYIHPSCTDQEEARVARLVSLLAKAGALAFILFLPTTLAVNFQLLAAAWIIQISPAFFLGLYTNWFHRLALIIGLLGGMITCTLMVALLHFQSQVFPIHLGAMSFSVFYGIAGLVVNLLLVVTLTPLCRMLGIACGYDRTSPENYRLQRAGQVPELSHVPPAQTTCLAPGALSDTFRGYR